MKANSYLYILPFNNGKYFKIGISTVGSVRTSQHRSTWDLEPENGIYIRGTKKAINTLERVLLQAFPVLESNQIQELDGYTEVKDMMYFDDCISIAVQIGRVMNAWKTSYQDIRKPTYTVLSKDHRYHTSRKIDIIKSCNKRSTKGLRMAFNMLVISCIDTIINGLTAHAMKISKY